MSQGYSRSCGSGSTPAWTATQGFIYDLLKASPLLSSKTRWVTVSFPQTHKSPKPRVQGTCSAHIQLLSDNRRACNLFLSTLGHVLGGSSPLPQRPQGFAICQRLTCSTDLSAKLFAQLPKIQVKTWSDDYLLIPCENKTRTKQP